MYDYPENAKISRVVPKAKIYSHGKVGAKLKERFVSDVAEIIWKYKLAPETVNLPPRDGIHEIEVFEIALKTQDYDPAILRAIDKAVPYPIVFELTYGESVRFAASYKRPSDADSSKWVIEAMFALPWRHRNDPRSQLPVALDLASLYEQIVREHIPIPAQPDEPISAQVARYQALESKRRETEKLEARLDKEKQFNRKIELNRDLRELRAEIEALES